MHGLPSRSGAELLDRLRAAAEAAEATLLTGAQVEALVADAEGTPRGLVARRPDGGVERIGARAIVLACSGYGGDPAMVRAHIPSLAEALYFGHPGNTGDAAKWGEALGAELAQMSGHQGHGSVAHPAGILVTWAVIAEGGVQVNAEGLRFWDESQGYSEAAEAVLAQPGGIAFDLFDARIAGIARQFEDFRSAEAMGAVLWADDAAALAGRIGVPAEALAATLAEVAAAKAGAPDRFGRGFAGAPPLAPPFAAVRVTGALFHTQGGLVVDARARVRHAGGGVFANLLAAGGAACGVSGPHAAGYLSGNGLLTAVVLGRLAGAEAARISRG
jgi:fumarate reductase flavoprotein subunit